MASGRPAAARDLDISDALARWPLPLHDEDSDKEDRGCVVMLAGSRQIPGAAVLAATAALRAGAGKVRIAAPESIALPVAIAVPEARVMPLKETKAGAIAAAALDTLDDFADAASALLIGPGFLDGDASAKIAAATLPRFPDTRVILDAAAMNVVRKRRTGFSHRVLLTPHAGEMAALTGARKKTIEGEPAAAARRAARDWSAAVALKGAVTHIAVPDGRVWRHEGGNPGLAVSGSGDVLAGVIAGLAARGMPLEGAAAWGVTLHARAGDALARCIGPFGYLARELAGEIPALMASLSAPRSALPSSPSRRRS